jgi:imidazolonepropionase-like amidohydrolase
MSRGVPIVLLGGTVYTAPDEHPIHNGTVLIVDGLISAVGPRNAVATPGHARRIDCTGMTVTAGFWNSHVHFTERKWADASTRPAAELAVQLRSTFSRFGFTSVFDLSSPWRNTRSLRDRVEAGEIAGPRIRSTGEAILPAGSQPPDLVSHMMGWMTFPVPQVTEVAEAAAAATASLAAGIDALKVFVSGQRGPALPEAVIAAAAAEAHRADKLVFAHPNSGTDIVAAVRGGVDIVAHTTPASGPWEDATIAAMHDRHAALIPTLWIWKYYARHDAEPVQTRVTATAVGQLRAWCSSGGAVLFGTDLGAVDPDPVEEYELMAASGMTFREILASLTTAPAGKFGDSGRLGRLAPGFLADITVVSGDPNRNIRALADVQYALRDGEFRFEPPTSSRLSI